MKIPVEIQCRICLFAMPDFQRLIKEEYLAEPRRTKTVFHQQVQEYTKLEELNLHNFLKHQVFNTVHLNKYNIDLFDALYCMTDVFPSVIKTLYVHEELLYCYNLSGFFNVEEFTIIRTDFLTLNEIPNADVKSFRNCKKTTFINCCFFNLIPPSTENVIVQEALIDETDIVPPFKVNISVRSLLFKKCQFFDYAIESIIDTVAAYFPNVETLGLDVGDDDGNTNFFRLRYKTTPVNHKIKKLLLHLDNNDYYRYDFDSISFNPRQINVNNLARLFPNVERLVLGRPFYDEYNGFDFSCFKNIKRTLCFCFTESRAIQEHDNHRIINLSSFSEEFINVYDFF